VKIHSKHILLLVAVVLITGSCKQAFDRKLSDFDALTKHFKLLEPEAAALQINRDTVERFFEVINAADLRLQLKLDENDDTPIGELLQNYQKTLKKGCVSFNESEKIYILEILEDALFLAKPIIPELFEEPIQLIKYAGDNYGDNVFYTRENAIVIPAKKLVESNRTPEYFLTTMLHEFFHLYSRKHKDKKEELYALIGFKPVDNLTFPETMLRKRLLNPDGMDLNYAIDLKTKDNQAFKAIPYTFSFSEGWEQNKKDYLHHLAFDLFRIDSTENGWQAVTTTTGYLSTISHTAHPEFREQIKNNTDYIIHPDEILADNFSMLAVSKANEKVLEKLDDEGRALIKQIEQILTK